MINSWQNIHTTARPAEASIIQGMLEDNQIPVQVMNKQDSSYHNFGYIEIYVPGHLAETAKQLIADTLLN
ncbi:DUF2007 domain-containing protein [Sediminibacterium roseum]|uniref:DUF2007 domain-containing protein n=1 Tax=Sediminibacterium roseum TaxID=1978412 RepID=A0ABW9ZPL4_9BACT|nr:DUF2007 domain-containing protein [Sediminibacterium roseum]NCI48465.1 DUF2007 domain-containing protein [Sediminibacterium roseum]